MDTTNTEKSYKFIDKRGKQAGYLYPSISSNPQRYRPRYYSVGDTRKTVTSYDRIDYMTIGRSLFGSMPDLGGAIMSKAQWCVGPGSYTPLYIGKETKWGDAAEEWLVNQFYPICSVMGPNFNFQTLLYLSSIALDVDGDNGLYFTKTRTGFPLVGLLPSHRIGQRDNAQVVKSGKFEGYTISDGVIIGDDKRPIAYRLLGDTPDEDKDIEARSLQLLYEPEWCDQYRGISRIARCQSDFTDQSDIDEFLKRGIKLATAIGLLAKTETGDAGDSNSNIMDATEVPTSGLVDPSTSPQFDGIHGGEMFWLKAGLNETFEPIKDERPSQNTEAFISRIQKRAMFAIGWQQELLDPSKIGGASVRLIQDLTRRTIASRQATLERRAKAIVTYALARAMELELIPRNDKDWYKWSFTKGGVVSVDNGKESDLDRENFKLGMTTLSEITAKRGLDWYQVREQTQKEVEDLIERAQAMSTKYKLPFETALTLLQQNAPNQSPVSQPPPQDNNDDSDEDEEDGAAPVAA